MSEEDVYKALLGEITIGMLYNSPIPGREDDTPSFGLWEDNGYIKWKDFGLADQYGNKPANLIQHLKGYPLTAQGFGRAMRYIRNELSFSMIGEPPTRLKRTNRGEKLAYVKKRSWLDFELEYWNRFSIDETFLTEEDVTPLDYLSWDGDNKIIESKLGDPVFLFWWSQNPASWKIYRPLGPRKYKFRQQNIKGVIEGWNSMVRARENAPNKRFKILFIVASSKDRFVLKRAFNTPMQYNAINPKAESERRDILLKIDEIRASADRVIIIYDDDPTGMKCAKILAEETGFETFNVTNKFLGHKDIADMKDTTRGNLPYDQIVETILNIVK